MERPTNFEKRRRLAVALMHHVVAAWVNRTREIADPVVLVADSLDAIGMHYATAGARAVLVSAAEIAARLDPLDPGMAARVRGAERGACFVVVCAFNGAIGAYINSTEDALVSDNLPGSPPTTNDAAAHGVAVVN